MIQATLRLKEPVIASERPGTMLHAYSAQGARACSRRPGRDASGASDPVVDGDITRRDG